MRYVDGYVLPVPTRNIAVYRRLAAKAARIWMDHGALEVWENVGDDLVETWGMGVPFPKVIQPKKGETIVFSWVVFKSRKHRDRVNAAVMKDPRFVGMLDVSVIPFDGSRMCYGGFRTIVRT